MNAVRAHIPMVEVIRQIYPRIYWDEGFVVYDFLGTDLSLVRIGQMLTSCHGR